MNRGALPVLGACSCALAQTWMPLGPAPISNAGDTGRVSAVACHPTIADRYYVGGADGGVWRTDDGGATWTPLTDHMPTSAIGAIAIDPANPDVIYVGTGEANFANHSRYGLGIYKSIDAGATWSHLGEGVFSGRCISKIVVPPSPPGRVYASATIAGGFPSLAAAKGHAQASGPVGVFRSDDGGQTWAQLAGGLPALSVTDLLLDPSNPQIMYAAVGHIFGHPANGVYKSLDAGQTWARLGGGLPTTDLGRIALAISRSNPSRLYALIARYCDERGANAFTLGAWRSDNAGASWTSIPVPSIQATYGWYLCVASVSPTNPDTVFFGGLNLVRSTNAGASFTTVTPPHVDMHAVEWDAAGRLVVGDDGGVHRSTNLGTNWSARNVGLGLVQFYAGLSSHPTDDVRIFGGTQDNGTNLRSSDSQIWTRLLGGDGGWTQWDQTNPQRLYAEVQGTGSLYVSTNGGQSWGGARAGIDSNDRNCFLPPYLMEPDDPQRMIYATHRIYRTSNGGGQWTPISADLTGGDGAIRAIAMSPVDPDTIYAATTDSRVLVSTDGGYNFTLVLTDAHGWPRVTRELWADSEDANTAYLAGARFGMPKVRRTRDRGQTWETLDGDLPDIPVNVVVADNRCNPPTLYAGTDAGVYRSRDDGYTWSRFGAGMPNASVIDLLLQPGRGRLLAATQGRGAWTIPLVADCLCDPDVNCDGSADGFDIEVMELAVGGDVANFCREDADFNRDGSIDGFDVEALEQIVGGSPCP
jgi:photosystem II stability/assembly factor-like uncharacterized protein